MKKIIPIVALVLFHAWSLAAPSTWTGLWLILQKTEKGQEALYLVVRDGDRLPVLYSAGWAELRLSDWKVSGNNMFVNWQYRGMNVAFDGIREGDKVEGTWQLKHPQFAAQNQFSAQRLFDRPDWSPLGAVDRVAYSTGLVDLNEYLLRNAPAARADFAGFWRDTFLPDFFPLMGGVPNPDDLFEKIHGESFRRNSEIFSRAFETLTNRLEENLQGLNPIPWVVIFPFGRPEVRVLTIQQRAFLLLDPLSAFEGLSGLDYELALARRVLSISLQSLLPPPTSRPFELYREGVPAYVVWKLGYTDKLSRSLGLSEEEVLELERERSGQLERLEDSEASLSPGTSKYFGFDFVRSLVEAHGLERGLRLNPQEILSEFPRYLAGELSQKSSE